MTYFPSHRRLLLGWAALIALALAAAIAGQAGSARAPGLGALALVAVITWVKAGVILRVYLNLRTAPVWADVLMVLIGVVFALIVALYVLGAS